MRSFGIRAGLVLMLLDGFTDRPAQESIFRVLCRHPIKIERKQGGILVLLDPPEEEYDITLESPVYTAVTLHICPKETCQVIKLRMIPGAMYPVPQGAVPVIGKACPGTAVYVACDTGERLFYLMEDYKSADGDRLKLYAKDLANLEGRQILLISENEERHVFLEEELKDRGEYRMQRPLEGRFTKIGTQVLPVYEGRADEHGCFRVLVKGPVKRLIGWNQQEERIELYF